MRLIFMNSMLTPEGPPPYSSAPARPLAKETLDKELPQHIISMPELDQCDNYTNR